MTPKEMAEALLESLKEDSSQPFVIGMVAPVCEAYLAQLKTEKDSQHGKS